MEKTRNAFKTLAGRPEGTRPERETGEDGG
jgi:hypothetical protein